MCIRDRTFGSGGLSMRGRSLHDALNESGSGAGNVCNVVEVELLLNFCLHAAVRGIHESGDGEVVGIRDCDCTAAQTVRIKNNGVCYRRVGKGQRVFGQCSGDLLRSVVFIDQQLRGHAKKFERVEDAHSDGVRQAVI